jgi:hypothetical protein
VSSSCSLSPHEKKEESEKMTNRATLRAGEHWCNCRCCQESETQRTTTNQKAPTMVQRKQALKLKRPARLVSPSLSSAAHTWSVLGCCSDRICTRFSDPNTSELWTVNKRKAVQRRWWGSQEETSQKGTPGTRTGLQVLSAGSPQIREPAKEEANRSTLNKCHL